ncbi:HpcH/HpaI aldolase family protein [Williamsia soli]|uniref:HpcH/HpaI aldolase family protein n=1 Tax=Williamsia soli TaxID=364929 RepID=UPI001A9FF069|nr:aldolase/citrate lyase family protein [Williamsia soli]
MNPFPGLPAHRAGLGAWIKLPAIESVELMAEAGMDSVVIDLEHSALSIETASSLVSVALGRGLIPMVRVPDHSPSWIQRCLDLGARAVVVPHVDSVEQARALQQSSRFEPRGRRGMGPTTRAGGWNLSGPEPYLATERAIAVVVQIESAEGMAALPDMLATSVADGVLLGAADLSMSLGLAMDDPKVFDLMSGALEHCVKHGVPCALAMGADGAAAVRSAQRGFSLIIAGNDATMLGAAARQVVTSAKALADAPS